MAAGIDTRHAGSCRSRGGGGRCNWEPIYQAHVYDIRAGRRIRKTLPTHAAAMTWRQDAIIALRTGGLAPTRTPTLSDALDDLIDGMSSGRALDRAGKPYKPATVRSYRRAAVRRRDLQDVIDALRAEGLAASTIHNKSTRCACCTAARCNATK